MGKKKKSRAKYISKGERRSIRWDVVKGARRDRSPHWQYLNKLNAWLKGQNPWISVDNPSCDGRVNTNKRMVRVRANDWWGDPRKKWSDKTKKEATADAD